MPAAQEPKEKAREASVLCLCCGVLEKMKGSQAATSECSWKEAAEKVEKAAHLF